MSSSIREDTGQPASFGQASYGVKGTWSEAARIGAIVRKARKAAGMTQQALADRLGVRNATVAQWERGWNVPLLESRLDMAQILDIPVDQMMPRSAATDPLVITDPELIQIVQAIRRWPAAQRAAFRLALTVQAETDAAD